MTQAIVIPKSPAIIPAATYITPELLATYETIEDCPYPLQAMETVAVIMDMQGNLTHLNGPKAGQEGAQFSYNLQGEHHLPFEQVTIKSAWQFGEVIQRQNYLARRINLRVTIGRVGMNNILYRACEDRFWSTQDEVNGFWFGIFTRYSGWRWTRCWPEKTVDTVQKMDPVAFDNNMATWDLHWLAPLPNYGKPALFSQPWIASASGPPNADGYYFGTIAMPNFGDMASQVEYLLTGDPSGTCIVQDNNSTNMVTIPEIFTTDGQVYVDSDPTQKTLVSQNDPVDSEFYGILRSAGLLNFLLGQGTTEASEALWLRGYVRFMYSCPPGQVTHFKVMHNNPNAQIVAKMPQRFKRSR